MVARNFFGCVFMTVAVLSVLLFAGCGGDNSSQVPENTETAGNPQASISESGWINLSGDTALSHWNMKSPGAWKVVDGVMEKSEGGGYIWTKERFGDFVLDCEFRISEGGNSGIFFRTDDTDDPVQTGIEMQVYNIERHPSPVKNDCGAMYDLLEPSVYADKPAGEWNHAVITCRDNVITVELNDTQIIDMDLNSWDTPGMNPDGTKNKFNRALKDFKREGYIGFQEHGDPVWYRSVRVKRL